MSFRAKAALAAALIAAGIVAVAWFTVDPGAPRGTGERPRLGDASEVPPTHSDGPAPDPGPDPEPQGGEDDPESGAYAPLAAFRRERDPHALIELASDMRGDPRARADADVIATMLASAESDDPARREAATLFLLGCVDPDGRVTEFLALQLRWGLLDVSELPLYLELNPVRAPDIHSALLDTARSVEEGRAQLIAAVYAPHASDAELDEVARYADAQDAELRAAAYAVIGGLPRDRADAAWLESRWEREGDEAARQALMMAMVRAGAADALDRTGDAEAAVWAAILREYPQHPIEFLIEERERRR